MPARRDADNMGPGASKILCWGQLLHPTYFILNNDILSAAALMPLRSSGPHSAHSTLAWLLSASCTDSISMMTGSSSSRISTRCEETSGDRSVRSPNVVTSGIMMWLYLAHHEFEATRMHFCTGH